MNNFSPAVQQRLLKTYHLEGQEAYQRSVIQAKNMGTTLLGSPSVSLPVENIREDSLLFATDSYSDHGFKDRITVDVLGENIFVPRAEKAKEEQKRRTKAKAEVFTPSWVVNLQNNLIDEAVLGYANAFNSVDEKAKAWTPTKKKIRFSSRYTWLHYVTEKRIEFTAGEAPYLVSRADTVTGETIPVRDEKKRFARVGLLDRKLRVAFENVSTLEDWQNAAYYAYRATYGYEWQGDNLVLARLNLLKTYQDYLEELWQVQASEEELLKIAEVISWNLWQMDGLKMTVPETCSSACPACEKKTRGGHDGVLSLVRMGQTVKTFEELGPAEWFPVRVKQLQANSLF